LHFWPLQQSLSPPHLLLWFPGVFDVPHFPQVPFVRQMFGAQHVPPSQSAQTCVGSASVALPPPSVAPPPPSEAAVVPPSPGFVVPAASGHSPGPQTPIASTPLSVLHAAKEATSVAMARSGARRTIEVYLVISRVSFAFVRAKSWF